MLLDHNEWMAYWEENARKYKPIGHHEKHNMAFARVIDSSRSPFQPFYYTKEFDDSIRDDMNFPCLIAESTRERFDNRQGMQGYVSCGLIVLKRLEDPLDFDEQNNAVAECRMHCSKLVGKLKKHLKTTPTDGHIQPSTILIHNIGPLKGGMFGARVEWITRRGANQLFCVNDEDWEE